MISFITLHDSMSDDIMLHYTSEFLLGKFTVDFTGEC